MSLSAFLAENALSVENVKFVASKRFLSDELDDKGKRKPMEWEIKAITGTEDEALRKSCAKRFPVPGKKNQYQKETDYDLYLGKLAVACTVFPNLNDKELQDSYKVMGAEALLKTMLTPGEYADYLTKVSESRLTSENSQRVRAMFKIVSEVESVADSILNVAKAIYRRNEQKITFPEELSNKLKHMFALVDESIVVMCANLATEYTQVNAKKAYELEQAINDYRTILKQEHLMAIEEKRYEYSMGILYNDLFSECEKIGDYTINVTQAMKEIGHEE